MSAPQPVVVKLGGDALATPERIVAEARRLTRLLANGPVIAVTSARRGVTDHLLGLVQEVRQQRPQLGDSPTESRRRGDKRAGGVGSSGGDGGGSDCRAPGTRPQ